MVKKDKESDKSESSAIISESMIRDKIYTIRGQGGDIWV